MHSDLRQLFGSANPNLVGELLRGFAFTEEFGCYSCFEVRGDATRWSASELGDFWREEISQQHLTPEEHAEQVAECVLLGEGYTFNFDRYSIDMAWYWDGDGILLFSIYDQENKLIRSLSNDDCKKNNRWVDPKFEAEPYYM